MPCEPQLPCRREYFTTAIPFVNASPHIGHALEAVQTDALARYARLRGGRVRSLTGTDDNSLKNALAAERLGIPTSELVAHHAAEFRKLGPALDLSFDDFIGTSRDPRHRPAVQALWRRCVSSGDIYRAVYRGLYCVGCEQFLHVDELNDGRCPEHDVAPEPVEEENYFFRLSRYEKSLRRIVEDGSLRIEPEERRAEIARLLESGLKDFSVSRTTTRARGWGIPVPGDDEQIIFVWFDALTNYISALSWPDTALYGDYWERSERRAHVIGKGILRFHAVYWPAILLSAGLPLPTHILTHGYVTAEGRKVGKSLRNAIDPFELSERFGSDVLRYFLLRHIHCTKDSDFDRERLVRARDAELADQLGNLVRRVITLVARERGGDIPAPHGSHAEDEQLVRTAERTIAEVAAGFESFALHDAVAALWRLVAATNRYADRTQPWRLAKAHDLATRHRADTVLYHLVEALRIIAPLLSPIIPNTAQRLAEQLGLDGPPSWPRWSSGSSGTTVRTGEVLFSKARVGAG